MNQPSKSTHAHGNEARQRATYQRGTLMQETRKRGPFVWAYRYSKRVDGRKIRPKVIVGTVEQYPTKADALRASEHLRLTANSENPQPNATMRGVIDRFMEEILRPSLDVPVGGIQDQR